MVTFKRYFFFFACRNKNKKKKKRRPVLKRRKVKTTLFRLKQPNQIGEGVNEDNEDDNEIYDDGVETTTSDDISGSRPLAELSLTTRTPKTIILSNKILPKSR